MISVNTMCSSACNSSFGLAIIPVTSHWSLAAFNRPQDGKKHRTPLGIAWHVASMAFPSASKYPAYKYHAVSNMQSA